MKVYLIYSTNNNDIAARLIADLNRVGVEFIKDTRNPLTKVAIQSRMAEDNAPIYMFVSDDFLKSEDCMEGALQLIQNARFSPRIKPIVLNSRAENEAINLDNASNVIKYMTYWQDEYLRLRRERRDVPSSKDAEFQARMDKIRRISNEIGEFLRALKSLPHMTLEALEENKFKQFFNGLGFDNGEWHRYSALPPLTFVRTRQSEEGEKFMLKTLKATTDAREKEGRARNEVEKERKSASSLSRYFRTLKDLFGSSR